MHIVLLFRICNNGSFLITGSGGPTPKIMAAITIFLKILGAAGRRYTTTTIHQYKIPATLQIQVQIKRPFCLSFFRFLRWGAFQRKKEDITPSHSLASSQYVGAFGLEQIFTLASP